MCSLEVRIVAMLLQSPYMAGPWLQGEKIKKKTCKRCVVILYVLLLYRSRRETIICGAFKQWSNRVLGQTPQMFAVYGDLRR